MNPISGPDRVIEALIAPSGGIWVCGDAQITAMQGFSAMDNSPIADNRDLTGQSIGMGVSCVVLAGLGMQEGTLIRGELLG
jgi:hypothetical protein